MRVFGKASDFYRLRVLKVSEDSAVELDWKKDISFRSPSVSPMTTKIWYVVQVVNVDDDQARNLKKFSTGDAAVRFRNKAEELLRDLTKQQFEERFSAFDQPPQIYSIDP